MDETVPATVLGPPLNSGIHYSLVGVVVGEICRSLWRLLFSPCTTPYQQAVQQWKGLGKVLCRLLRMSDYWYGFVADDTLSREERTVRRITVLQQARATRYFINSP